MIWGKTLKNQIYISFLLLGSVILLSGCDSDSDNRGGSSGGSGSFVFAECAAGRTPGPVPCTLNIDPVCGLRDDGSSQYYDNDCLACADPGITGYWPGACMTVACTTPRPEACTREYVPVCGLLDDGTRQTMANGCEACANDRVVSYLAAECRG